MKRIMKMLLLISLAISLLSIPVSAKTTYYLPDQVRVTRYSSSGNKHINDYFYSYDEHGHLICVIRQPHYPLYPDPQPDNWSYNYNKKGIRESGKRNSANLYFDDKGRLIKITGKVKGGGYQEWTRSWNSKGYLSKTESNGVGVDIVYKYNAKGLPLKETHKDKGKTTGYSLFNSDGFIKKDVWINSNGDEYVYRTFSYKKGKNGLVKTKKERVGDYVNVYEYFYSDIKTDVKTYSLFISGYEDCYSNANM